MADQTFTAGQILTAAQMTTLQKNSGLTPMVPTSVAGTGVSVASSGKVTFTTATQITVNGCFTSAYDYYRVVMNVSTAVTGGLFNFQMRVGGVTAAGATDYSFSLLQSASAGTWLNLNFSAGTNVISLGYDAASATASSSIEIVAPALAQKTSFTVAGQYAGTPYTGGGQHALTTAYDGFVITPSAGSITGTLMVYGYRS
jgi:hypothetical protein